MKKERDRAPYKSWRYVRFPVVSFSCGLCDGLRILVGSSGVADGLADEGFHLVHDANGVDALMGELFP